MSYALESKNSASPTLQTKNTTSYAAKLLQENGDAILTEDGFSILLEPSSNNNQVKNIATYTNESKN